MKKYRLELFTALCSLALSASPVFSSEVKIGGDKNVETALSIYNNNLAFVKDTRRIERRPANRSLPLKESPAALKRKRPCCRAKASPFWNKTMTTTS